MSRLSSMSCALGFSVLLLAGCSSEAGAPSTDPGAPRAGETGDAHPLFTHASSASAPAAAPSREDWRKAMSKIPAPKEGCFQASHPSMRWQEVPCTTAPEVPYAPATGGRGQGAVGRGVETVGNGADYSSEVSGTISWAEGSFPSVTGVTGETDGPANNYSLQLNSNFFAGAALCNGAKDPSSCQGWQQFIYTPGAGFMQYWLINYANTCPAGWNTYQSTNCWKNSNNGVSVPAMAITNLANMTVTGTAGATDAVTVSTGDGALYTVSQASVVNLNTRWNAAEFNVIGNANGSQAVFNSGATIVVQTLTDSVAPTTAAPVCEGAGFTGETNNLSLVASSCCPIGGAAPGIQFTESNAANPTAAACPGSTKQAPNLMWWNETSGQIGAWELNTSGSVIGTRYLSETCTLASGCAKAWTPVDGQSNSILWNDPTNGQVGAWQFDPSGQVTIEPSYSLTCGALSGCTAGRPIGRVIEGTQAGLVWHNGSSGAVSIWNTSGTTVTGSQAVSLTCGAGCSNVWRAILTADMNGDGNTDIVWYNQTSGQVSSWLLDGPVVLGTQPLSLTCTAASGCASTWSIVGAADVNGDGHTDLTWWDRTSGQVSSWLLNGSGIVAGTQALNVTCSTASGCATAGGWRAIGYASFP